MTRYFIWTLFGILTFGYGQAQTEVYEQRVYNKEIKNVKINPVGDPLAMPIIPMNGTLSISFDDIGEYLRNLEYTIIHCDKDWTKSNLTKAEFLDGFDDARMDDFINSRGTYVDYMHYFMTLPNSDIRWSKSGNYILKVWDRDNNNEVLMELRFIVFETRVSFSDVEVFRSTRQGMFNSHHQLSFSLGIKNVGLDDPMQSVTAAVFQNNNWSTLQSDIPPRRVMNNELFFDQHNSVVFPSMREYRLADLRSMLTRGFNVHQIETYADGINVTMETDEIRGFEVKFGTDRDVNGGFVNSNEDALNSEWGTEYAYVLFSLHYFNSPPDADIYILGGFNDYVADESSLMDFNEMNSIFYKEILLKQGVYDYVYGVKVPGEPMDYRVTEGYDNRANNDYHIVVYYRPFLGTYDRVISYTRASS